MAVCKECGLLAMRRLETFGLDEVPEAVRNGDPFPIRPGTKFHSHDVLKCAAKVVDIEQEITEHQGQDSIRRSHVVAILNKDRPSCSPPSGDFIEWTPSYSPREHREMKLQQQMLEWQAAQEEKIAERDRQWRKEDVALIESQQASAKWQFVAGMLMTLVTVIVTLIAAGKLPWFGE